MFARYNGLLGCTSAEINNSMPGPVRFSDHAGRGFRLPGSQTHLPRRFRYSRGLWGRASDWGFLYVSLLVGVFPVFTHVRSRDEHQGLMTGIFIAPKKVKDANSSGKILLASSMDRKNMPQTYTFNNNELLIVYRRSCLLGDNQVTIRHCHLETKINRTSDILFSKIGILSRPFNIGACLFHICGL